MAHRRNKHHQWRGIGVVVRNTDVYLPASAGVGRVRGPKEGGGPMREIRFIDGMEDGKVLWWPLVEVGELFEEAAGGGRG